MGLFKSGKKKVLVADDDAAQRFLLTEVLGADYEVSEAADGQEVLESTQVAVPDLILLDVSMPRMSGRQVLDALRMSEKTKLVPVVMCTGYSELGMVEDLLGAGANDYLTKPINAAKLLAKLDSILSR